MKWILMILTVSVLLATSGCVVANDHPDHHDRDDEGARGGVDHSEHPGDFDHGDPMQQ